MTEKKQKSKQENDVLTDAIKELTTTVCDLVKKTAELEKYIKTNLKAGRF